MIEVIPCGTKATTIIGNHTGIIIGITIRNLQVMYDLAHFHNGDYKVVQLYDYEMDVQPNEKIQIGFKKE